MAGTDDRARQILLAVGLSVSLAGATCSNHRGLTTGTGGAHGGGGVIGPGGVVAGSAPTLGPPLMRRPRAPREEIE